MSKFYKYIIFNNKNILLTIGLLIGCYDCALCSIGVDWVTLLQLFGIIQKPCFSPNIRFISSSSPFSQLATSQQEQNQTIKNKIMCDISIFSYLLSHHKLSFSMKISSLPSNKWHSLCPLQQAEESFYVLLVLNHIIGLSMSTQTLVNQVNLLNHLVHTLQKEKATLQSENQWLHNQFNLLTMDHNRAVEDSSVLKQKNQELHNKINILSEQLHRLEEVEKVLAEKESQLAFFKTQNKKFQAIISKNKQTVDQLSLKKYELEKVLEARSQEYNQMIREFESNTIPQLQLESQSKDRKIGELTSHLAAKEAEIRDINIKLTKQSQILQSEKDSLEKRVCQLTEKYSEAVNANQKYSKSVLNLQTSKSELQVLLEKEKVLSKGYQNKIEVDSIIINRLEFELKEEKSLNAENITKLNNILAEERSLVEKQSKQYAELFAKYQDLEKQKVGGQSQLVNRLQERNTCIKKLQIYNSELSLKIESLVLEKKQLQNLVKQHENEIQELKVEMDILQRKIVEHEAQISSTNHLKESLQKSIQNLHTQNLLDKQQFTRKEDFLKQKIISLEKQVQRLQGELRSNKIHNLVEGQSLAHKDTQISSLKHIITEQEQYISDQKKSAERLTELLSTKDEEIENLQTNNSMLRKQIMTVLANQDSARKEMLLQKETSLTRRLKAADANANGQPPRRSSQVFRKRLTVLTQQLEANIWQDLNVRRSEHTLNFVSQKNVNGCMKERITVPSSEGDYQQV